MSNTCIIPDLEARFRQPEGWRWHHFERAGRSLRCGSVFPQGSLPDAVIVCLQGVREFSEKYYELAQWCTQHNLAFWTFDWAGQGKSTRYLLQNPQKRHSTGFQEDVDDLHYFITNTIKHDGMHPDKGHIPMAMLAHSMGGNLGLHYLCQHPEIFECAAFTAPMIGLKVFENIPQHLTRAATQLCKICAGTSYVTGGQDWRNTPSKVRLSSDPIRQKIHNQWCAADPALQCGDVTYGWLYEAQKSCLRLQKPSYHKAIETPCLFALPRHEDLVDNAKAQRVINAMKNAKTIHYPDAAHEILMEKDYSRGAFLHNFYGLIKETIIDKPKTLKSF